MRPQYRRHHVRVPLQILRTPLLVVAVLVAAGCGLPAEPTARAVASERPVVTAVPAEPTSTGVVQIYLLRDGRLVPVDRAGGTSADALVSLAAGPTPLDTEAGLTSALPPDAVSGVRRSERGVVTIDLTAGFAALPARDRLLAAAQLAWTATGGCCDTGVRILLDGRPVPVPTDGGPAGRPVGRDDYRSLTPR